MKFFHFFITFPLIGNNKAGSIVLGVKVEPWGDGQLFNLFLICCFGETFGIVILLLIII
jgi:hypothetical protein